MKRLYYVETADARYTIEAQLMQVYEGTVNFFDKPEGSSETITVLSFRDWVTCGLCDSKTIQAIEVKGK